MGSWASVTGLQSIPAFLVLHDHRVRLADQVDVGHAPWAFGTFLKVSSSSTRTASKSLSGWSKYARTETKCPIARANRASTLVPMTVLESSDARRVVHTAPSAPHTVITHEHVITGGTAEALWQAYLVNFEPLAELAALQHFYSRDEILSELRNPRITKIVGWQNDEPVGLAMVTNSLEDVPQISPAFLRATYPEQAARDAIYVCILLMIVPRARRLTLFGRLTTELWQVPAMAGGILVYDVCEFNRVNLAAERLAAQIADNFPRSSVNVLDRQTWYVAELPEPIPFHLPRVNACRRV